MLVHRVEGSEKEAGLYPLAVSLILLADMASVYSDSQGELGLMVGVLWASCLMQIIVQRGVKAYLVVYLLLVSTVIAVIKLEVHIEDFDGLLTFPTQALMVSFLVIKIMKENKISIFKSKEVDQ